MRILVTAGGIAPSTGGARTGILGICRGLARRGHQITLITTNADGKETLDVPLGVATLQDGVDVYYYPAQFVFFENVFSVPMTRALKRQVVRSDIVLIHSLYSFSSTITAHYCRKFNVPYILRPHGTLDPFLVHRRRRLLKLAYIWLFENRNFRFAAATQFSGQMEMEVARSIVTINSPSLIIPEGIDLNDFVELPPRGSFRARYPAMKNKTLILFLGRFHQKKGLDLLIDAFALVADQCPNAHLVLAGTGDQGYMTHIVQKLCDAGLTHQSTMTGQLGDYEKRAALADADLFALPSHGENFGIAVVEAMACGIPVLLSDKIGIWQDVSKAEAGIITQCDATQIAEAMEKLVNDHGLRSKLGQNGRNLVARHFNIDRMAEKMEIEYHALYGNA